MCAEGYLSVFGGLPLCVRRVTSVCVRRVTALCSEGYLSVFGGLPLCVRRVTSVCSVLFTRLSVFNALCQLSLCALRAGSE